MRFGLVGTGYWARVVHGAVLSQHRDVELVGVWGRDPARTAAAAMELGTKPFSDYAALLDDVEAVSFALDPLVQGRMAIAAAGAGKHLMLDKPVSTSALDAAELAEVVDRTGVSSVVFFTYRFAASSREWLREAGSGEWSGAWARFIVSAFGEGSPYASSAWRREKGALWDAGPHVLSILIGALGPVVGVTADGGRGDLVHLILEHGSGATSTASMTLHAPAPAINVEVSLWGRSGLSTMPRGGSEAQVTFAVALEELMHNAAIGRKDHPCDVRFGAAVVKILSDAEAQIAAKG